MTRRYTLDGEALSASDVAAIARSATSVVMGDGARAKVARAHDALREACAKGTPVYGANTGVGARDGERVAPRDAERLQASLLRSHAMGVGDAAPAETVRAMMAVRTSQLAMGRSGISAPVLDVFVAMLDRGVTPRVPALGSVGASDLAPLAHAALPLIGEGSATYDGTHPRRIRRPA